MYQNGGVYVVKRGVCLLPPKKRHKSLRSLRYSHTIDHSRPVNREDDRYQECSLFLVRGTLR